MGFGSRSRRCVAGGACRAGAVLGNWHGVELAPTPRQPVVVVAMRIGAAGAWAPSDMCCAARLVTPGCVVGALHARGRRRYSALQSPGTLRRYSVPLQPPRSVPGNCNRNAAIVIAIATVAIAALRLPQRSWVQQPYGTHLHLYPHAVMRR
jgi:hypothetical protein